MRSVGAVILAAGGSKRLGQPKQLLELGGETLLRRIVRSAGEAGCAPVVVVAGAASPQVEAEIAGTGAQLVVHGEWERGLGSSIKCGTQYLLRTEKMIAAAVLLACDQPSVAAPLVRALISRWEDSGKQIVASSYAGTLGIPALFDCSCFDSLLALPDHSGAKPLIQSGGKKVASVEFEAGALDIDTPADYARAAARFGNVRT